MCTELLVPRATLRRLSYLLEDGQCFERQPRWTVLCTLRHITGKAVRLCLEAFAKVGLVRGRSMLLYEDNTGVVGILKNLCAKSPDMRPDLEAIMELLEAERT